MSGIDERIECVTVLSERQKGEVVQLLENCRNKDGIRPDFFMEQEWNEIQECPCFFLLYREEQLVCAVSVFLVDGEAEVSAATRFESRGRGFFSKVLRMVFVVLEKYGSWTVIFRIEGKNRVAQQILEHWGFRKEQTDYLMVLLPEEAQFWQVCSEYVTGYGKGIKGDKAGDADKENRGKLRCLEYSEILQWKGELSSIHASAFGCSAAESEWIFESYFSDGMELWGYWVENRLIGLCFVSETEQEYFLSAVSICKKEQQKGYGTHFLQNLLACLWERERKRVSLQVSGENRAAIRLYKKLGFSVKQQLITYLIYDKNIFLSGKGKE